MDLSKYKIGDKFRAHPWANDIAKLVFISEDKDSYVLEFFNDGDCFLLIFDKCGIAEEYDAKVIDETEIKVNKMGIKWKS